jgi:fructose/tagatose bisphosphate aldolase
MKVLQDLLALASKRVEIAHTGYDVQGNEFAAGILAAAARAHADVATAVATHKHTLAEYAADTATFAINSSTFLPTEVGVELMMDHAKTATELMQEAEVAELAAWASKDRATKLGG